MRLRFIAMLAVVLVCFASARSQVVNEATSSAALGPQGVTVTLSYEYSGAAFEARLSVELLDEDGNVVTSDSGDVRIRQGRRSLSVQLPLEKADSKSLEDVIWYRVRYRLGRSHGLISLSQLIRDFFEISVASPDKVRPGQRFLVRVRANDPFKKTPIEAVNIDASITLDLDTEEDDDTLDLKASSKTDSKGIATLEFNIPADIKIDYANDLEITAEKDGFSREVELDMDELESTGMLFFTMDKPIYQPGQRMSVRALLFDINKAVLAGDELQFSVYDEEKTLLYRETVSTSDFGVASISWKIPENAKLGDYSVEVEADEDLSSDTQKFRVTRYDLPNFTVNAKPDKSFYLPADQTAEVTVTADYLFGKPVTQGNARVVLEEDRKWDWKKQSWGIKEEQAYEGETDALGKFTATFDLSKKLSELKDSSWKRFEDLHLAAYFTDLSSNRTEQRRFDIRLSKEPIHVYLSYRGVDLNPALPINAYLSAFYADGTPAECDVTILGKNEDEKDSTFQNIASTTTNRFGAGKTVFRRPEFKNINDDLALKVTARDRAGAVGTFEDSIYFYDTPGIVVLADKAIHIPGEPIRLEILSTIQDGPVFVDVVGTSAAVGDVVSSRNVDLKNGRATVEIPYKKDFQGALEVWVYTEYTDEDNDVDIARAGTSVIYPKQQNLLLDAKFSAATYKPGEDADVSFAVTDGGGRPAESALGVVVFDKAVEERARTDADFGSYFGWFNDWLGYSRRFGSTTLRDLNDLDLSKPIPDEMQLTAELVLLGSNSYFRPQIERSEINLREPEYVFKKYFSTQLDPVQKALDLQFALDYSIAEDQASFESILAKHGVTFGVLTDPWGQKYRAEFTVAGALRTVTIISAGADKKFGTKDDLRLRHRSFAYFRPIEEKITKAAREMRDSGRGYIRTLETLKREVAVLGLDLGSIRDPWGNPYRFTFEVYGRNYYIEAATAGPDGKFEDQYWKGDDAQLMRSYTDYFSETESAINRALSIDSNDEAWKFPESEKEFWHLLSLNGIERESVVDGNGRPVYVVTETTTRYTDKVTVENGKKKITPMTEVISSIVLMSLGQDGVKNDGENRGDDFRVAWFSSSSVQRIRELNKAKTTLRNIVYKGSNGAITGTVTDMTGAVVPGATVSASNEVRSIRRTVTTDEEGIYLIESLPTGKYRLEVDSPGFLKFVYSSIEVRAYSLTELNVSLEAGSVTASVEVASGAEMVVNTSSAMISTSIDGGRYNAPATGAQMETPRLREYFPETLVWQPEIITDKNGKAELKFRMADNITTWKMYTVASTKNGKIGISEKEVQAFKPFFADLEPPKFLTTGDEIYLPVQIRNYTPTAQPVNVTMANADWFSFLGPDKRTIDVASNTSENAVFGFRADKAVNAGKQRVTAIAKGDSDAIEKPVTVRPNGQEINSTESKLFSGSAEFRMDFPEDAIEEGRNGRLRLYPNLLANVADSADGLLHRPYGCGEQTISSTYPNLMILKLTPDKSPLQAKAEKFLRQGYERLLGYQDSTGGFTYWGSEGTADISLTAYAIRFVTDAKSKLEVDDGVIRKAENWLVSQQRPDGSWSYKYSWEREENLTRAKMITSYVVRALAMSRDPEAKREETETALRKGLDYLKKRNSEIDEPYALALYGLASLDAGYEADAAAVASQLEKMMIPEGNAAYWKLETNTPFYGWGTAGRIETTALVVQLLERTAKPGADRTAIQKGTMFLMKNKDRYGVWYSTQTTINVLDALIAALEKKGEESQASRSAEISVNGKVVRTLDLPPLDVMTPAIDIDLTNDLGPAANTVTVRISDAASVMAQAVGTHYIDWQTAVAKRLAKDGSASDESQSRLLELDYSCDNRNGEVMETVTCSVRAERVGFRGYGMLLAEIGTPPGADVSRESLEKAMQGVSGISRYDVLPDRLIVYMWANPGGTKFDFTFKPRYAINAQTPASVIYDYYNDEARAVVAPLRFSVREE